MNVPSGYTALDMVGFTDKGAYNSATSYVKNDLVRYNGDTWRCKLDDTVNHTPEEGTYWTIFIDAPSALDDLTDVTISSVANGDVLEYDSATSKWKNSTGLSDVKQALSDLTATVSDSEPYVLRQGKGSLVDFDMVGGTVAWNQPLDNGNFESTRNWDPQNGTRTVNNNILTLISNNTTNPCTIVQQNKNIQENHVILMSADVKSDIPANFNFVLYGVESGSQNFSVVTMTTSFARVQGIIKTNGKKINAYLKVTKSNISDIVTSDFKNAQLFDLTQMFGTTIADYIYSLEQATAGAGVAWFRQYFPKEYYAYNAGQLLSVRPSRRKVAGKNLLDPSTFKLVDVTGTGTMRYAYEPIKLIAGTYTFSRVEGSPSSTWYITNVSKGYELTNVTSNPFSFTLDSPAEIMVRTGASSGGTADTNIQLEFGSTATDYTPYDSTTYDFPSIDLRGLFKLDANNKLYADGDVYKAGGSITRKYGIVDLGSLTWGYDSDIGKKILYSNTDKSDRKGATANAIGNIICPKYVSKSSNTVAAANPADKQIAIYSDGAIFINDLDYTDGATFKTAMSGVYLVYELATPTTESAPIFVNPQRSFADGTEEWLDTRDVTIPVGNNSTYYLNDTYPPVTAYADGLHDVLDEAKAAITALGTDESGRTTASRAYEQGEFFYQDGKMYKALTSIASGATFTVGTNCSQTTIFAELKALAQ